MLCAWLDHAALRLAARQRLRQAGWTLCGLLLLLAAFLALRALLPQPVLTALVPLLALSGLALVTLCARHCWRAPDSRTAAAEVDARSGLNNEILSAYWFAQQGRLSGWETLVVQRAARSLGARDVAELFPLRLPGSVLAAGALGALVLGLSLAGGTSRTEKEGAEASPARNVGQSTVPADAEDGADEPGAEALGSRVPFQVAQRVAEAAPPSAYGTSADLPGQGKGEQAPGAGLPPGAAGHDRTDLLRSISARDSLAEAARLSAEVMQDLLDRVSAAVGKGRDAIADAGQDNDLPQGRTEGAPGAPQEAHDREKETHVTMEQLSEALRALSQAPTGDTAMPSSAPSEGSQGDARGNIKGGAMGVRVNTSELGEGGDDQPPDVPSESPEGPLLGKASARRAAQLRQLASASSDADDHAGGADGFYAVTQAQAARVGMTSPVPAQRAAGEAALAREQVPLGYRASVKRYFLLEHGRER